jgi:hypothetical protein
MSAPTPQRLGLGCERNLHSVHTCCWPNHRRRKRGLHRGTITKVGTATYTANNPASLAGVAPVVTATGITGDNSATWNPTINVAVPGGTAAGTYSATITHSLV